MILYLTTFSQIIYLRIHIYLYRSRKISNKFRDKNRVAHGTAQMLWSNFFIRYPPWNFCKSHFQNYLPANSKLIIAGAMTYCREGTTYQKKKKQLLSLSLLLYKTVINDLYTYSSIILSFSFNHLNSFIKKINWETFLWDVLLFIDLILCYNYK